MRPGVTVRIGAALAAISFVVASGLSASGLHASLHAPSQVESQVPYADVGADVHDAQHSVHPSVPDTHEHDTSDDCACVGTCASATPRAAPSSDDVVVYPAGVELDRPLRGVAARAPERLKAYLFPLPNAPPLRV